jgi:hypothetical protein
MKILMKTLLLAGLFVGFLNAGENFSEMSTQELIAIMGYVRPSEAKAFERELKSRVDSMSKTEKAKYEKNLPKLK